MKNFFCRNLLISRYSLSNRRYIEIIADIFRVVIDIFEKSLIYLVRNPPGISANPTPSSHNKKRPAQQGASFIYYPVPAARMFGGFTSSYEAKAPLRQKLHPLTFWTSRLHFKYVQLCLLDPHV